MNLEQILIEGNFKVVDSIKTELSNKDFLSKGILEDELKKLILEDKLEVPQSDKANSSFAFNNFGEGLKISFNYGSQNEYYVSVIIYDGNNLEKKHGHKKEYILEYPKIQRKHKIDENPYVLRTSGDLVLEDIKYLLIRKKKETIIYRRGVLTNPEISLINSSKEHNPSNLIFGEYHFKKKDQSIQEEVISDIGNLDYIISEVLGEAEILSKKDIAKFLKNPKFNPKLQKNFQSNEEYNISRSYLIDWFNKFEIPIIGIGNFYTKLKPEIESLYKGENKTLSLIGRSHISQIERLSKKFQTFVPIYDRHSNLG